MSDYRLVIQPEADSNLESAHDWYESQREGLGIKFVEAVEATFLQILRRPTAYAVTYRGCRQYAVRRFPYVIHYLVADDRVSIAAVLHGHRDPTIWQERIDKLS